MNKPPFVKPHWYQNPGGNPECPYCGATHTRRKGYYKDRQRYQCVLCQRFWSDPVPEPRPVDACPNCGARCVRYGISKAHGTRRFLCRRCGRVSVNLYPVRPRPQLGKIKRYFHFCLDLPAFRVLDAYCRGTKMSAGDAVRRIFAEAARPEYNAVDPDAPPLPVETTLQLPKLPDCRRRRRYRSAEARWNTGRIVHRIGVTLDPTAFLGLLRTMEERELNMQDASRFLLSHPRVLKRRGIPPEEIYNAPRIILPPLKRRPR